MSADTGQLAARDKGFLRDAFERGGLAPSLDGADAEASPDSNRPGSEFIIPVGEDARREAHQRSGNDGFIQSNLVSSRVTSASERTHREKEKRGGARDEMFRFYLMNMRGDLQDLADKIAQELEYWNNKLAEINEKLVELGYDSSSVMKARKQYWETGKLELDQDGKPLDLRLEKFIEMWEQKHGKKFDPENDVHVNGMLLEADEFNKGEEIRLRGAQTEAQANRDKLKEDSVRVNSAIKKIDEADTPEERLKVLRDFNQDEILQQLMAEHGINDDTAFDPEVLQALDLDETGFDDFGFDSAPDVKSAFDKASSGEASADFETPKHGPATDQSRANPTVVKFDF